MSSFTLEILTPDKPFFKGNVGSVVVKGSEGFLGILAQHAPLLVRLTPGPLRIKQDDAEHVFIALYPRSEKDENKRSNEELSKIVQHSISLRLLHEFSVPPPRY